VDRRGARHGLLIGLALAGAAAAAEPPLRAARWLAVGHDPVVAFAFEPTECLAPMHDPAVEIGRAAFRTPLLLGGQAARAGLSCASCHRGGRGNPDFAFPGLSGAPGTADVTSSLMSKTRGDSVANPKPIPSLVGVGKVDRRPGGRALETFVHDLVVEEFDGQDPPPRVLAGLAAYVRALQPSACPADDRQPVSVAHDLDAALRAVRAAGAAFAAGDRATGRLMIAAARSELGTIDERYTGLAGPQRALATANRALADAAEPADPRPQLAAWLADVPRWSRELKKAERQSLYDRRRLASAFGR
jgi:hypothetical protein